ncbi:sister chromatid cohesion protein PDS5 homolog D-like [Rutidosis leptorrhynchoides]|uniref:sister chromatid cohesion protein PDS5 homolog D-like n=1 Tax=Rutidosis leptorrhynchoides TaxID=125765 RepID=UPI003A9A5AA5
MRDPSKGSKNSTKQSTITDDEISSDYDGVQNKRIFSTKKRVANDFNGKEKPKKLKQDLVGCRIKVWWPLDKMYYKGVVSSYDSITDKYKVLYADGDEELLNLHHEKWIILDNLKNDPAQTPDVSYEHKTEKPIDNVLQDGAPTR